MNMYIFFMPAIFPLVVSWICDKCMCLIFMSTNPVSFVFCELNALSVLHFFGKTVICIYNMTTIPLQKVLHFLNRLILVINLDKF